MKVFSALFSLSLFSVAQAQKKDSIPLLAKLSEGHRWEVSASPFALLQPDNTLMSGAEYLLNPRWRLTADAGYVFYSMFARDGSRAASGFVFRPGAKYFFGKRGYYLQAQAFYKRVSQSVQDWVDKDVVNGIPAYAQFQRFNLRRNVAGVNLIYGEMMPFFGMRNVFVDTYVGIGLRTRTNKPVLPKTDSYNSNNRWTRSGWLTIDEEGLLPSVPIGVRLLFVIR